MNTDSVLQAILLLCSFFNKSESRTVKPLTPTEYSRLAAWLHQNQSTPADFLTRQDELLNKWQDPKHKITKQRLEQLLQRAASMGFALEKWQQQNVWILSRASQDYPRVLREKLADTRSPLLYGIGNKALLKNQSIGFVGSRSINAEDEAFTQSLAQQAVEQGFSIVSGGAKGVDQTSMLAAIEAGGSAIGILADSLLKTATKHQYRQALQEGRLLLITPYYPEASFHKGNAMGRNKYIYSLSKGVVVAKSGEDGGTWTGATENLKKQWVPLWVRDIDYPGNKQLIALGGQPLSGAKADFATLSTELSFKGLANKASSNTAPSRPVKEPQPLEQHTQTDIFTEDLFASPPQQPVVTTTDAEPLARQLEPSRQQEPSTTQKEPSASQAQPAPQPKTTTAPAATNEPVIEPATEQTPELTTKATPEPAKAADKQIEQIESEPAEKQPLEKQPGCQANPENHLGTFLDVFYAQLKNSQHPVHTPKQLAQQYPELTEAIIKQWLKELDEKGLVKRQGRKLAYTLSTL